MARLADEPMDSWLPALIVAAISATLSLAVSWGFNKASMDNIRESVKKHSEQHREHYTHASDPDAHWTSRERDNLTKRLDEIAEDIKEILRRNGGLRR